jgi:transcriptional regulator with XRE-family HTH domain
MSRERIGTIILRRLEKEGLSQADLARKLGVHPITVGNWIHGRTEPRGRNLKRVEQWLDSGARPGLQGGPEHRELQERLRKLGKISNYHVETNRDIGGGHRPDVLWYRLDPEKHEKAQPQRVFEIELNQGIQKSLATLKHAYDLGNAELFLFVPERKVDLVRKKVNGAFHEIEKSLSILPFERCPEDIEELKYFLDEKRRTEPRPRKTGTKMCTGNDQHGKGFENSVYVTRTRLQDLRNGYPERFEEIASLTNVAPNTLQVYCSDQEKFDRWKANNTDKMAQVRDILTRSFAEQRERA